MSSPEQGRILNKWVIPIHLELSETPDGVRAVEQSYYSKVRSNHTDIDEYTEAIGKIISNVNDTNPDVLMGAVTVARKLKLWHLEPEVRILQESQSEAVASREERAQIKREADIFLGFKRYHAHLTREKELEEKPYLVPRESFKEVIEGLDLSFFEEQE